MALQKREAPQREMAPWKNMAQQKEMAAHRDVQEEWKIAGLLLVAATLECNVTKK